MKSPSKAKPHPPRRVVTQVREALDRFARAHPAPQCELFYKTPFQLLLSVVLSAQTTDKKVNQAMTPLYEAGFGFQDVLNMGEEAFRQVIREIGLAKSKARYAVTLSQMIRDQHRGQVPKDRTSLEALPGVGRKTASVVLGELFGEPTLAVDTHVLRVTERLGWHQEKTPEKAEKALLPLFPPGSLPKGHHWLVLHGRYVCQARKPACPTCLLQDLCPSFQTFSKK